MSVVPSVAHRIVMQSTADSFTVRMGTLYVPAAIAWGLCVPAALKVTLLASRLATRTEAPSWSLNQLRRKVLVAVTATLGVTIFLMIEGLAGGANGYWPGHSAEGE